MISRVCECKHILALVILQALQLLGSDPVLANTWVDITPELSRILKGSVPGEPVYLKTGSIGTVKSANYKNTYYRKAVISYLSGSITTRSTYMFDCQESNYKTSELGPGDWSSVEWITPDTPRNLDWAMYKYLCPGAKEPWQLVSKSISGEYSYFNVGTGYTFTSPRYGKVSTWITYTTSQTPKSVGNLEQQEPAIIRPGDSLSKLAARHNLSISELLRLNPGLQAARLVAGTTIRTNRSALMGISRNFDYSTKSKLGQFYASCQHRLSQWYSMDVQDHEIILEENNPGSVGEGILKLVCERR